MTSQIISEERLCQLLDCSSEQLAEWTELLPQMQAGGFMLDSDELQSLRQAVKVLKSGMTANQVGELIDRDRSGKLLTRYALLAEDCPANVTAHMLRSLCVVILAQNRQQRMLSPSELADASGIDVETAKRHMRILQAVGLLHASADKRSWEFAFVPRAISS